MWPMTYTCTQGKANQSIIKDLPTKTLSMISDLSQKFRHDLWRVKSELKLSQKQHLTPGHIGISKYY